MNQKQDKKHKEAIFRRFGKDEGGQAMTEFVIVFPVVFILVLVFIQTFLLLATRHMVNYAAFCAARSAIVFYPEEGKDEAENKAKRAAVIALIAVSPMKTFGAADPFIQPIEDVVEDLSGQNFDLGRRYSMAKSNVEVTLTVNGDEDDPHVDITADVTYYCVMGIPLANTMFFEMGSQYCARRDGLLVFTLKASCTLPAAGKVSTEKCCS